MMIDYQYFRGIVGSEFDRLGSKVSEKCKSVVIREGFFSSQSYLFRGYISFSVVPGDEVLVVSVDCKNENNLLIIDSDLSEAGGKIIADGPSLNVSFEEPEFGDAGISNFFLLLGQFMSNIETKIVNAIKFSGKS